MTRFPPDPATLQISDVADLRAPAAADAAPAISVIMATYNGAATIRASVASILSQTWRDLELIVADDRSTDDTAAILASIDDPRLRIVHNDTNLGVVAARNRCVALARGDFIAMLDHDDLSAPTRLARQIAYLRAHPGTVLVGTAANTLQDGRLAPMTHPRVTTPGLIQWLLLIANPLVCASIMFRADAVRRLGVFMRDEYRYADDYDFYHRMATLGAVARLDETLTIYRLHEGNAFKKYERTMADNAVKVLLPAYRPIFGDAADEAARLVVDHLSAGRPAPDEASLARLCQVFDRLNKTFLDRPETDQATRDLLRLHATQLWQRLTRATRREGRVPPRAFQTHRPEICGPAIDDPAQMLLDRLPLRSTLRRAAGLARRPTARPVPDGRLFATPYEPCPPDPAQPPTLFVVVDTEAEFDWHKPFARDLTSVSAMDDIERGQAIFDRHGLRPIYVIDHPVASQQRGYQRLRAIMERDGCAIGAHLHPWTTPPFEEELSARNSFPGNLDPALEDRKLATLMQVIRDNFGISPVFYKAGRYGFGPATAQALARHGLRVDLSLLPGADLRREGGPDFRAITRVPYRIGQSDIVSVPMTRAAVGLIPALGPLAEAIHRMPGGRLLHVPSILSRLRLADTITLTPEGVTAEEQIRLLRALIRRGERQFVLHYHSPSLSPGHTPYAPDRAGSGSVVQRLSQVCRFFFEELGGLPGYPADLLRLLQSPLTPLRRDRVG